MANWQEMQAGIREFSSESFESMIETILTLRSEKEELEDRIKELESTIDDLDRAIDEHEDPQADALRDIARDIIAAERRR